MNRNRFLALMIAPFIVMLGFVVNYSVIVFTGTEIILETRPVDPVDLFRGNYVDLTYEISAVEKEDVMIDRSIQSGDEVYGVLVPDRESWQLTELKSTKPQLNDDEVCMKGVISSWSGPLRIKWGIESFFAPTEEAQRIERVGMGEDTKAVVSVDSGCRAVLRGLIVKGELVKTK